MALRSIPDFSLFRSRFFARLSPRWISAKVRFPARYHRTLVDMRRHCDDDCALTIWLVVSGESTRPDRAHKQASVNAEACSFVRRTCGEDCPRWRATNPYMFPSSADGP